MKYRIEQIIDLHESLPPEYFTFYIREYASHNGEYYNEAVLDNLLVSDAVGVIIEVMPFNPTIYYTKREVLSVFIRLEDKARRIKKLLETADNIFKQNVRTKT